MWYRQPDRGKVVTMLKDNVFTQLYMVARDVEEAIASLTEELTKAFLAGNHEEVDRLNNVARQLRGYCEEVKGLQSKWIHTFDENIRTSARYKTKIDLNNDILISQKDVARQDVIPCHAKNDMVLHEKDDKTNLRVRFPSGKTISNQFAAETFAEVIQEMGMERVKNLNMRVNNYPLISTEKHDKYGQYRIGKYFVMTHSSTKYKKDILERIAKRLKINITITIIG